MDISKLISVPKAAKLVGMPPENLRHYIGKNKTPKLIDFEGRKYFIKSQIQGWEKPEADKSGPKNPKGKK